MYTEQSIQREKETKYSATRIKTFDHNWYVYTTKWDGYKARGLCYWKDGDYWFALCEAKEMEG